MTLRREAENELFDLSYNVYLNKMFLIDFLGIEKFFFTVSEETNFIVFHSKDIDISSRTINERLKVERMLEYPQREQVYLETDEYMVSQIVSKKIHNK